MNYKQLKYSVDEVNELLSTIEKNKECVSKFKPKFGASPYFAEAKDLNGNVTIYTEEARKQLITNYSLYGIKEYPIIIHVSYNEDTGEFYIVEDLSIIKNVIEHGIGLGVYPICIKMHAQRYNETHIDNYGHSGFYEKWLGFIDELVETFKEYDSIEYLTVHNEVGYLYGSDVHEQFVLDCLNKAREYGYKTGVTCAGFSNFVKIKESIINNSDAIFINHYQTISDKGASTTKRDSIIAWEADIYNWINHMKKYNKPLIISETGVQNNWYALSNPGRWDWDKIIYSADAVGIYLYGLLETLKECEDIERVWWWYDVVSYECCQKILKEYLKGE